MTFKESLEWLFSTQKFGVKLGLENTQRLLDTLGKPQAALRFLHVAGTNGKGSVSAMMESILRRGDYRTGLFTSPHLIDFCERIRVSGEKVSEDFVAEHLTEIRNLTDGWDHSPTFFEITTALAFQYFSREKCEIVVLETGMGGRLDATNIIKPLVSVLTPIALDHQQWLGVSIEEIAAEKAGIFKQNVPVVSAWQEPAVAAVFEKVAQEKQTTVTYIAEAVEEMKLGLMGSHQRENAALAIAAIRQAGLKISDMAIREGLKKVEWPGRFQIIDERHVLDGAHNPAAALQLLQTWQESFPNQSAVVIFGALKDKDSSGMLDSLCRIASRFIFIPVDNARSDVPQHFQEIIGNRGMKSQICSTLREALQETKATEKVLITGSLFLVGEALALFRGEPQPARSLQ